MEQALYSFSNKIKEYKSQALEIDSALKESEKSSNSYRIIGNIMVLSSKEEIKDDLESKKKMCDIRIESLSKQEKKYKDLFQEKQASLAAESKQN